MHHSFFPLPQITFTTDLLPCCLFTQEAEQMNQQEILLPSLSQIAQGLRGDTSGERPELALRSFGLDAGPVAMKATAGHGAGAVPGVFIKLQSDRCRP